MGPGSCIDKVYDGRYGNIGVAGGRAKKVVRLCEREGAPCIDHSGQHVYAVFVKNGREVVCREGIYYRVLVSVCHHTPYRLLQSKDVLCRRHEVKDM